MCLLPLLDCRLLNKTVLKQSTLLCQCLQNKVILASKLFWHDTPPFTPYSGLWKGHCYLEAGHSTSLSLYASFWLLQKFWLLLPMVTVIAKWKTMNLKIPITLGLTAHRQATSHFPLP